MTSAIQLGSSLAVGAVALAVAACGSSSSSSTSKAVSAQSSKGTPVAAGCPSATANSMKGKSIVVGTAPGPDNYDAPDPNNPNQVIGIEPDIVAQAAKCLGFTYSFTRLDFNGLIPAAQAGHIGMVAAGMYASDQRAQQINFVEYMKAGEALVVQKGNPKHLTSLDAACGTTAAEVVGTVENAILATQSAKCTKEGKPGIKAQTYQSNDQAVNAVAEGRADIFMTDAGVASYLAKTISNVQVGFPIPSNFVFGLGVPKGDTQLLSGMESVLSRMYSDGALSRLMAKWGFSQKQMFKPMIKT